MMTWTATVRLFPFVEDFCGIDNCFLAEDGPTADYPEEASDEDDEFDPYEYRDSDDYFNDEQDYLRDQGFHPAGKNSDDD